MIQTDRLQKNVMENLCNPLGLGRTLPIVLAFLKARSNHTTTQADVASYFDVSAAATTVTLKRLEKAGLIKRAVLESNARANEITLTEKGRSMADSIIQTFETLNQEMMEGISDEEQEVFQNCMMKMQDNLRSKYGSKVTRREK